MRCSMKTILFCVLLLLAAAVPALAATPGIPPLPNYGLPAPAAAPEIPAGWPPAIGEIRSPAMP